MISKLCVRGTYKNQCEDSVFVKETESFIYGCVCDGCSTGINSAWASQTLCYFIESYGPWIISDQFLCFLKSNLLEIGKIIKLDKMKLLSTLVLFRYDKETKNLKIRVFGDSVYYINNKEFIVDQNNTPDYLAYHLNTDDFLEYLNNNPIKEYENVKSFQICTDGIKSFSVSQFETPQKNPSILLEKPTSENYLQRMFNILKKDKWIINDDLSIVSYAIQQESDSQT